jgi:hypothetical protein
MKYAALVAIAWLAACASQTPPRPAAPAAAPAPTAKLAPASAPVCRHAVPAACKGSLPDMRAAMPIFEKRCFGCHTGDGVAAEEHDFSHVEALRAARATIADEISTCSMPPRSPLDDGEASTLLLWAACADTTD